MTSLLRGLVWAVAALLVPAVAWAQPSQDAGVCGPIERELDTCRREKDRATKDAAKDVAAAEQSVEACKREVEASEARAQQSAATVNECQHDRDRVCSATAAFVDELSRGRSRGASETGCVSPEQQTRLDAVISGMSNTTTWLGQLTAYESGETDTFPYLRLGGSPLERGAARVGGTRAFHRRLLVEALKLVAPRAWQRIHGAGAAAIDAWFASKDALDAALVSEAQSAPVATPGAAGPPLVAALHLVRAFQLAAACGAPGADPAGDGECARARQLQQILESTGPLVVRRRVQEIWATDCATISSAAIAPWVEDFPNAHGASGDPWSEIGETAIAKLFARYLDDATEHKSFGSWIKDTLPAARTLTAEKLRRVDAIRARWVEPSPEAACARAVRAMQTIVVPPTCEVPLGDFREALTAWTTAGAKRDDANVALGMCAQFAQLLWEGKAASISGSFAHPPSLDEMVSAKEAPPTPMWRLRAHCEERRGTTASFAGNVQSLATFARGFGEGVDRPPFRVDPRTSLPAEYVRFEASRDARTWVEHVARGASACSVIGLDDARCKVCSGVATEALYDCSLVTQLEVSWTRRTTGLLAAIALLALGALAATWLRRLLRAREAFVDWARETSEFFDGLGLSCRGDRLRALLPSRYDTLTMTLPPDSAWQRWGSAAVVVRAPRGRRVLERDVNHTAFVARRIGASVALLEHDDAASPDMSAVRAMLEWAGKGGSRAVQILPIGTSRVRWSKSAGDVLDLVEESSLRGNPFEVRGRIATSTQFFNRERLVSGLLAAAQAGHWTVVTGLRRFGKSSLALEVARRLSGPSAYVDVAGFDHEIATAPGAKDAADRILRFVCLRLVESARSFWPSAELLAPPGEGAELDAAALTLWFREFSRRCRDAAGRGVPMLIVIDEIEQALGGGPERLGRALDVLAIVVGRLKSAVGDTALPDGGAPIGVFLASALHPLLWAPLRTLAHQSIMGSFQRVCVPCLDDDAALTMMRSLGARQGIRFTDAALALMVAESQGIPILLRRLGAAILELYDAERARQGSLGAVEVGAEGTREAIDREARAGSFSRVSVETEIAAVETVPGALLRRLARSDLAPLEELWTLAKRRVMEDFAATGIAATLPAEELDRRAEEAAHVIVQMLDESGLVAAHGDLTAPTAYSLPDGVLRRVLGVREQTDRAS